MTAARDKQRDQRLKIMAVIAGGLSLFCLIAYNTGNRTVEQSARTGTPVLPGFAQARAEAETIRVTLADEAYQLVNTPTGWKLDTADGYTIRADRLTALASGLEGLVWEEPRTQDPSKFNYIGLGDPRNGGTGALIEVIDDSGEVRATLITGRRDDNIYARLPDDTRAFRVVGDLPPLYTDDAWLDLDIIQINPDAVSAIRIYDRRGESLFLRRSVGTSDRSFFPAPPFQDFRLVSRLAASTPSLALTRFQPIGVRPATDLTTRVIARHITQTHDGLEVELRAHHEPDGYFVTLRAIEAGEGAHRASTINQKAEGWAFEITEFDWNDFTPDVNMIVRPPVILPDEN